MRTVADRGRSCRSSIFVPVPSRSAETLSGWPGKGEGYVGQGLDVADILAVLFLSEMRYDPVDRSPRDDRLIFSAGHYSIGLWAALAEAGHLDGYDLETYGADGATLIMSTHEGHPASGGADRRLARAWSGCCRGARRWAIG